MMLVDFDGAPAKFAQLLIEFLGFEAAREGRILRDIYGRLSFVTQRPEQLRFKELRLAAAEALGAYGQSPSQLIVSLADDGAGFEDLIRETSTRVSAGGSEELRMIDRRLAGDDWLMRPERLTQDPPRLIFYAVKGGVGRSTALAIAAAELAARGRNVLVIDLDLEAPGLGAVLLMKDDIPKYGVTDWLAAVAAGADSDSLVADMVGSSSFTSPQAVVDVVPAAGREPGSYLSKLSRAYTPGSAANQYAGFNFPRKVDALINRLTSRRTYDAVFIDARAGLHETSGGLLLGLGAKGLLFGIDTSQTFDDFRLLFSALSQAFDPSMLGADLRFALKMVHAKAPTDEADRRRFRESSWEIWSEFLYDDVDPGAEIAENAMVFDLPDEDAPHYPLEIISDGSYARFDPRSHTYPLSADAYKSVFGKFLSGVWRILDGS